MSFVQEKNDDQSKKENLFNLLSPLPVLHVALLIRLSLIDRHLPTNFPSITFSLVVSESIIQFQQHLAVYLSSYSPSLSYLKVVDMFDGRLFAFTINQVKQSSSKIQFDSNTMDIIKEGLSLLEISMHENLFYNIVDQLIQLNHIVFSTSTASDNQPVPIENMRISKISNPFIDTYLAPTLSTNHQWTFDFLDPDDRFLARYQ
ncbi:unnamed protein product, partial [Rotaria sp. Silwood1]